MTNQDRKTAICKRLKSKPDRLWKKDGNTFAQTAPGSLLFEVSFKREERTGIVDGAQIIGEGEHAETVVNQGYSYIHYRVRLNVKDMITGTILESYEETGEGHPRENRQQPLFGLYAYLLETGAEEQSRSQEAQVRDARKRLDNFLSTQAQP